MEQVMETTAKTAGFDELENFAIEKGASSARVFPARLVVVDERVRLKCQIPLCPHYGQCLTCPPNVPGVEEFSRALKRYEKAMLVQTRTSLSGEMESFAKEDAIRFLVSPGKKQPANAGKDPAAARDFGNVRLAAVRLHKLVNEVEGKAMSLGFHYALGLIGGECMLCPECAGAGQGKGCRRPYEARPSMEGVGIDVIETSRKAGLPFEMPPKKEIVWSGLILID
jgi:predicted metal-binding protein